MEAVREKLVSVIIPNFNRSELLGATLASVKAQTYRNWECIVVDDGSTDRSEELVGAFSTDDARFRFIQRPAGLPKGANTCRVLGFETARGEYVKWFDSDDVMLPDFLQSQVNDIGNRDGILYSCEVWNDTLQNIVKKAWRPLFFVDGDLIPVYLNGRLGWQTGCGLWKRASIASVKPFEEQVRNSQEWLFHLKVITSGLSVALRARIGCKIRASKQSISRDKSARYFYNRAKARVIALRILAATGNSGKWHLLKVIALQLAEFVKRGNFGYFSRTILFFLGMMPSFFLSLASGQKSFFKATLIEIGDGRHHH